MDDKDLSSRNIENGSDFERTVPAGKPTLGARWKIHFKKWWWVYIIIFIIVVLVTVLPM